MIIQFTTSMSGAHGSFTTGHKADLPEDECFRLIKAGFAEPVGEPQPLETAAAPQPKLETATAKTAAAPKPPAPAAPKPPAAPQPKPAAK